MKELVERWAPWFRDLGFPAVAAFGLFWLLDYRIRGIEVILGQILEVLRRQS